jgi:hypothetical protein
MKTILLASVFTLSLPVLAMAQTDTTSHASSVGQAASQSISGASQSGVSINETTTDSGNYPADQTIRNNTQAPDIVTSGANACALPIGGSTSVLGFGFGFGATPTDKGCERRDNAAALFAMGYRSAAVAIMCQDDSVARAMRAVGSSCTPDASPVAVSAADAHCNAANWPVGIGGRCVSTRHDHRPAERRRGDNRHAIGQAP